MIWREWNYKIVDQCRKLDGLLKWTFVTLTFSARWIVVVPFLCFNRYMVTEQELGDEQRMDCCGTFPLFQHIHGY